jgi:hypothetical protein
VAMIFVFRRLVPRRDCVQGLTENAR